MLTLDTIGKGLTFAVSDDDIAKLLSYDGVKERVVRIGLSNILKDSHASITSEKYPDEKAQRDAAMAMVQKTFDAMMAGEVRSRVAGPRVATDPVGKEAARLARVYVGQRTTDTQLAAWATKFELPAVTDKDSRKAVIDEAVSRYAARTETIAEATANVAKLSETVAVDVDL